MLKNEYLDKLDKALSKLKEEDRKQALAYYEELIDEHMENCHDEKIAISKLRSIEEAVKVTYDELPTSKRMVARFSTGNVGFNICLIIMLFPLWLPFGIVFFIILGL